MRRPAWVLGAVLILPATALGAGEDGSSLTLADLGPYRTALERPAEGPAVAVTFRELWGHPDRYQGRRVRVEGRVARRFRQGAFGTFPPLVEVWAVAPSGDPFCLVFPASGSGADAASAPGASVRFEGSYLKRLRYRGADTDRLAPLIVGDRPPAVVTPAPAKTPAPPPPRRAGRGPDWVEWALGLAVGGLVALALAHRHLSAPSRRPLRIDPEKEPPPEFLDGA